jgi:hypothetical protein
VVSHNGFEDALFEAEVMRVLDQHSNATTTTHAEAALAQHDNSSSIGSTGEVAEEEVAPLFLFWAPHSVHSPLQVPAPYLHQFDGIGPTDNRNHARQIYHAMVCHPETPLYATSF